MVDLIPNPFQVGNIGMVSMYNDAQETNVNDMMNWIRRNYGFNVELSAATLTHLIDKFNIDYPNLPKYLKDVIDTIDVY